MVLVQLGRVPPPLFVWCMAQSGWPAVFEGNNSANDALNLGRQYFYVARKVDKRHPVPDDVISYGTTGKDYLREPDISAEIPRYLQLAANQVNVGLTSG